MDFRKVLGIVGEFLLSGGYRHALAGAFALHAYGLSRATSDLDLVVEARARSDLVSFLESLGYETLHRSTGYSCHIHSLAAMGRIDCIYVDGETSRQLFDQARLTAEIGETAIPVPRPEHLAAMKIFAMKNDPSRALKEMADIQFLLSMPGTNGEEIRRYFEKHGLLEVYDEIRKRSGPVGPRA
jgi:hypothetical protein